MSHILDSTDPPSQSSFASEQKNLTTEFSSCGDSSQQTIQDSIVWRGKVNCIIKKQTKRGCCLTIQQESIAYTCYFDRVAVNSSENECVIVLKMNEESDFRFSHPELIKILCHLASCYNLSTSNKLLVSYINEKNLSQFTKSNTSQKTPTRGDLEKKKQKQYRYQNPFSGEHPLQRFDQGDLNNLKWKFSRIKQIDEVQERISLKDLTFQKLLGKGAFGHVFLTTHIRTKQEIAVKVMSKQLLVQKQQIDNVKIERLILERIKHPFIMSSLGYFEDSNNLYLLMNVIKGGELYQHLRNERVFSEERVRFYCAQIILAIEYLHQNNLVYGDLKLENLLLGEDGYLYLTDFGLAKSLNGQASRRPLPFCGTPEYLSPEIILGYGSSKASDWWSLGTILYEMLQRMPPFYDRNHQKMFEKIVNNRLIFSETIPLPSLASDLISKLLIKNPNQRFGSKEGAEEIKKHPWFTGVDWQALLQKQIKAPFQPKISENEWQGNFDSAFLSTPISQFFVDSDNHKEERKGKELSTIPLNCPTHA